MSTTQTQQNHIVALFADLKSARDAVQALRTAGLREEHLSLLASGRIYPEGIYREIDDFYVEAGEVQVEEATQNGAAVGGVGGFLVGLTTLTAPGAGPLLVVGSALLSSLAGAVVGGMSGGAFAVLMDLGLPETEIESFEVALDEGKTILVVRSPSALQSKAEKELERLQPLVLRPHAPQ